MGRAPPSVRPSNHVGPCQGVGRCEVVGSGYWDNKKLPLSTVGGGKANDAWTLMNVASHRDKGTAGSFGRTRFLSALERASQQWNQRNVGFSQGGEATSAFVKILRQFLKERWHSGLRCRTFPRLPTPANLRRVPSSPEFLEQRNLDMCSINPS